jgi:hypothetical protein
LVFIFVGVIIASSEHIVIVLSPLHVIFVRLEGSNQTQLLILALE